MTVVFSKILAFFLSILAIFGINVNNPYDKNPVDTDSVVSDVILNENNTVTIAFAENPSTGYSWEYDVISGSADLKDSKYVSDNNSERLCGVGGTRYFTFDITSQGTTEIEFQYLRAWEDTLPAYKYVLTVVKKDGVIVSKTVRLK